MVWYMVLVHGMMRSGMVRWLWYTSASYTMRYHGIRSGAVWLVDMVWFGAVWYGTYGAVYWYSSYWCTKAYNGTQYGAVWLVGWYGMVHGTRYGMVWLVGMVTILWLVGGPGTG